MVEGRAEKRPWKHLLRHLTLAFALLRSWSPRGGKTHKINMPLESLFFTWQTPLTYDDTTVTSVPKVGRDYASRPDLSVQYIEDSSQGTRFTVWTASADWRWRCMRQHGHWHRFRPPPGRKPPLPPGGHSWQACHFDRKHTDVSPEGKEGCICTSTSVTWLPAKQHLKSLWFISGQRSLLDFWQQVESSPNRKCEIFRFKWRLHSFIRSST